MLIYKYDLTSGLLEYTACNCGSLNLKPVKEHSEIVRCENCGECYYARKVDAEKNLQKDRKLLRSKIF